MKLAKVFFYLFLISIPFGTRILLYQFTPGFNEYASAFLYASDIFLILFLLLSYSQILKNIGIRNAPILIFLLLTAVSVLFAVSKGLAVYNLARLFLLVLTAIATAGIIKKGIVKLDSIFAILAGSAVFQSIIGFPQFIKQSSLGLSWLGESPLSPDIGGVAKIVVDGVKILRAYGTFPHPNVLAAFLLLGLFSLYYLFLRSKPPSIFGLRKTDLSCEDPKLTFVSVILASAIFIVLLGLILTFSRTAWAIAGVLSILFIGYLLFFGRRRRAALALLFIIAVSVCALVFMLAPYIYTRATISQTEPALTYRLEYNKLGVDLIKKNPLGVGIGNQVLYSAQNGVYQKFGMDQPWQWQPIHNIYLLIASETGVAGLLVFIVFLFSAFLNPKSEMLNTKQSTMTKITNLKLFGTLKFRIWNLFRNSNLEISISKAMLTSLLLFGLFDHFLWTLQPGRLMLWLAIGILMGISGARSSTDRTPL